MRRKIILILTLLLISDDVFGKNRNRSKQTKPAHKSYSNNKHKVNLARVKRSLEGPPEKVLILDKENNLLHDSCQYGYLDGRAKSLKFKSTAAEDSPFWGNRGRRDSSSEETVSHIEIPSMKNKQDKNLYRLLSGYKDKLKIPLSQSDGTPFWDNRGRRESTDDDPPQDLFWANRGRRQDEDPFWGTRGRRQEDDSPFWGNRGRRETLVLSELSSKEKVDEDNPFWGPRGRRQEEEPFWSNRGKKEQDMPYLGSGKYKAKTINSYKSLLNRKKQLEDVIINVFDDLLNNNDKYGKNRKEYNETPYWVNQGENSKYGIILNGVTRNKMKYNAKSSNQLSKTEQHSKRFQMNTVHDDRMYADEPHYIIVERSSRASGEEDPFFITRGKKYSKTNLAKAARGRRGALEDILKSVKNDPYNIARGKKDYIQIGSSNTTEGQFIKTKDLICASVDLLMMRHADGNKAKREVYDNDRDRRDTLKKLALQLQMDPYFVSRGKKDAYNRVNLEDLEKLINKIIILCN